MTEGIKDEGVGKGRPPAASKFKPGKSGNPRRRKKGAKNVKTIVCKVAHELHSVVEGGVHKQLPTINLIFKRLQARSLGSELEAKKLLDQLRAKYQQEDGKPVLRGIIIPPVMELDEWMIHAAAQRKRMLWVQANRERVWAKMGLNGASSDTGCKPIEKP